MIYNGVKLPDFPEDHENPMKRVPYWVIGLDDVSPQDENEEDTDGSH